MKRPTDRGMWIDKLHEAIGKPINLETHDGAHRNGRLSSIIEADIIVDGNRVGLPTGLEINGDPSDVISVDRIKSIDIG